MDRGERAKLGAATLRIIEQGGYVNRRGERVELAGPIAASVAGTVHVRPEALPALHGRVRSAAASLPDREPRIDVTDETTLMAVRRLVAGGSADVAALNFASAKNPGGGFLGGSRAQEESLARSSALYASLRAAQGYYDANRASRSPFYTDHVIYSPSVPVFRDDDGRLLDTYHEAAFVTAPAVNVSALRQHGRDDAAAVERTMARRVPNVLAVAADRGHRTLVLGAWGCGVFGNDPALIARLFHEALAGPVGRCFARVVFAVFDPSPDRHILAAFRERFTEGSAMPG